MMKETSMQKRCNSETVANPKKKTLFAFSAPNDLPSILLRYCTGALNHLVYCCGS
jgi:hypothetical protein